MKGSVTVKGDYESDQLESLVADLNGFSMYPDQETDDFFYEKNGRIYFNADLNEFAYYLKNRWDESCLDVFAEEIGQYLTKGSIEIIVTDPGIYRDQLIVSADGSVERSLTDYKAHPEKCPHCGGVVGTVTEVTVEKYPK